jgi:hypothetical protein
MGAGAVLALALCARPSKAAEPAGPGEGNATVVALDGPQFVVDLGTASGASVGDLVELWRPVKLKHPVTGRILVDRFRIGTLRLDQVGESLALASAAETPQRAPQPGDRVVLRRARTAPPTRTTAAAPAARTPAPTATPSPAGGGPVPGRPHEPTSGVQAPSHEPGSREGPQGQPATPPADPEAAVITGLFDSLAGADLVMRIRAYENYVRARPQGRYARVLYEEARSLRQLLAWEGSGQARASSAPMELGRFEPPAEALAETPLRLAVEIKGPAAGAVVHVRRAGEAAYASLPMAPSGPGYFSVQIPAERMRAPKLEYFVETVAANGAALTLSGTADHPRAIELQPLPRPEPPAKHDYMASILTDYADYNRMRHNDWASQTEGFFGIRYGDVGVRAVRSGFGVYRGAGGSIEDLDRAGKAPRAIGLTYGYLELEAGASEHVSFIGRGVVGLLDDGTGGGGQIMLRIGNDRRTNLLLGGELLGGVGTRGITQLELNTFRRFPIVLRTEVTNQPAGVEDRKPRPLEAGYSAEQTSQKGADVGARAVVQVGYRVEPSLVLALRGSYQGRTINHAGPGFGAGITYEW